MTLPNTRAAGRIELTLFFKIMRPSLFRAGGTMGHLDEL
jgi:hypothetical protein